MTTHVNDVLEELLNGKGFLKAPLEFAASVAELSEADRRKLSKSAQQLMRDARPGERENFNSPTHEGHMARLAVLAFGPRTAACRRMDLDRQPWNMRSLRSFRFTPGPTVFEEAAVKILTDRRPDWADEWLEKQIDVEFGGLFWPIIRRLIRDGVCRKPDSPAYLRQFAANAATADFDDDPELLEEAWKLFHVPTNAFAWLSHVKEKDVAQWQETRGQSWPQIFYYYAHQGRIDRGRLFDELLAALWREFSTQERAGLMHFHNLLRPSEEELLSRQAVYIELLRNPAAPVVTFTLKILKTLEKAKTFDAEAALHALPLVFDVTSKSQPKSALSLLKTLVRKRPGLTAAAIDVALRGLSHPESDVQIAAINCLAAWGTEHLPAEELASLRELVSPVARLRLEELLALFTGRSSPEGVSPFESSLQAGPVRLKPELQQPTGDTDALRDRIFSLPADIRRVWKLDESLAAFQAGEIPPPIEIDAAPCVLAGLNEVTPIRDVEELIDAVGQALERIDSSMEIERILDGLSRLGLERPDDFAARTSALRERMNDSAEPTMVQDSLLSARFAFRSLFDLLETWLEIGSGPRAVRRAQVAGRTSDAPRNEARSVGSWLQSILGISSPEASPLGSVVDDLAHLASSFGGFGGHTVPVFEVLNLRANLIRSRLKNEKKCGPLLSFPTHEHGWIDPRVLIDRLKQVYASGLGLSRRDFLCGLLRLAPDFREEAIRAAGELPEPVNRIVRYALGDDVRPSRADRGWKQEWLAAGRARSPRGRLEELAPLDLPQAANAVEPAQFHVRLDQVPTDNYLRQNQRYLKAEPYVEIEPAGKTTFTPSEYPVPVLTQRLGSRNNFHFSFGLPGWGEAWLASMWPANPDPALAAAVQALLIRLDSTASNWERVAPLMMPLLHSERGWSEIAIHALWLGMFSRDADARAVAIDALVEGLLDGRAHPQPLAAVLIEIARHDWAKLNRLGEGLRQATRISRWGSLVLARTLDTLIASWDKPPRDAHHILEIELELLMETETGLSENARQPLRSLSGSSKTARLARQLLQLERSGESTAYRSALCEGAELRMTRAEQSLRAFTRTATE